MADKDKQISPETGQPAGGPIGPNVTGTGPVAGAPGEETAAPGESPVPAPEIDPNDNAALLRRVRELEARLGEQGSVAGREDDGKAHGCTLCGAKFDGDGALGQYREHMASFHPDAGKPKAQHGEPIQPGKD